MWATIIYNFQKTSERVKGNMSLLSQDWEKKNMRAWLEEIPGSQHAIQSLSDTKDIKGRKPKTL